ncbi:GNAT family N-acetyltransferase [Azohydromonas sediminis]|uniref:GNAT family N-acetyltransferase n=1 Tax=Azohydromonas sediminis TaxID=2259674 RepID=UPI000E6476C7|nr:GNAT family N-acetyltransferase [Azohydromonas sediminis]
MGFPGDMLSRPGLREHRHGRDDNPRPPAPAFRWVPIRSLSERHRPRILAHLLALDEADRYLRFGHPATDAQIARYVDGIDFERDEVFGIFNRRLELIALAHLAYLGDSREAEFGVSVLPKARGRGYGARLFDHAVLHARNRGVDTMVIHALSENTAMLRIARNAGATIDRAGTDSEARLRLPPDDVASHVSEIVEGSAAEIDYRLKAQARRLDGLIDAIADVKAMIGSRSGQAGID